MSRISRARRAVLLLGLAFALALLGVRAMGLVGEYRAAMQATGAGARDLARVLEEYVRRSLQTGDVAAEAVALEVMHHGGPAAFAAAPDAQGLLRSLAPRASGEHILVVDAEGRVVAISLSPQPPAVSFAGRRWVEAHRNGADRHVGEAIFSRLTNQILFTYSRALRAADGALLGMVSIAMRPGFIQDLATEAAPGTRLTVWDTEGRVLARTGLAREELGQDFAADPAFRRMEEAPAGTVRTNRTSDGQDRVVAWRRLADWPVIVSVSVPVAPALAPVWRSAAWSLALLPAILAAIGIVAWLTARLGRQEEQAQAELAAANAALRAAAAELEARVAERTRDLHEAFHRLRDEEARFRGIFDASFQFMALLAPDGTLLEANGSSLRFVGRRPEEVVGRPFWETPWWPQEGEARARLQDAVRRAAAGEFIRYEAEVHGLTGEAALIDFSLKPVPGPDGRPNWLVAEGRDVTALKTAQAQLHEAQKLETLGQLTGGVAHDFNNLLMAVLGNLNLLKKRLPEDPRFRRLLDGAVQGAERGAALTQRLLAFARRQELRPEAIDLGRLARGLTDLLRRSLGPSIRIAIEVPDGLPPVRADANQLELALLNLALNARDAMPLGGQLLLAAQAGLPPALRPRDLPAGDYVRIAVTDTGSGMDASTLQRATEPFFTTKGPGKGSGLGLSMVHGLAAQSGGRLVIRSRPGEGTTVELWLPVAERAAAPAESLAAEAPVRPTRPLRILLVDDDPLIQTGSAAMLEDLGHYVIVAASGAAALEELGRHPFELMVTDFAMPGMNGLELVRAVRERRRELPIILATGYAELPAGEALDVPRLAKPYRQEELAAAIARVLGDSPPDNVVPLTRVGRG